MMKKLFALALIVALSACAGDRRQFYKDGVSPDEYRTDAYECERDMRQAATSFGRGATAPVYAQRFGVRCMESKGYTYGVSAVAPTREGWTAR